MKDIISQNNYAEPKSLSLQDARDLLDTIYLFNALIKTEGNITQAAKELDIGRRTIYELMNKYGINCSDGKVSIEIRPISRHIELCAPCLEKYLKAPDYKQGILATK